MFAADLEGGFALPSRWYADPEIFEAERRAIHERSWHFATHIGALAERGAVHVRRVAGVPIVLVRDDAGVHGFINICRHRGHPVVLESGVQARLQCHFHGWTYGLDGALKAAPRSASDPTFDLADFGLVPIQVKVWGPMVWVNVETDAPTFDEWVDGLPELLIRNGLDVTEHELAFESSWDIDCNWKVFQDNTIECYHCPTTHPEFARALEMRPDRQRFEVGGRYWIHHTIPFRDGVPDGLTYGRVEGRPFTYHYQWVFPSTYLQHAGRGFDIGSIDIIDVDRIRFRHLAFLPPGTPAAAVAKGQRELDRDPTIHQDVALCNAVQVGHQSGRAPTARLLPEPEHLVQHFHQLIREIVTGSGST